MLLHFRGLGEMEAIGGIRYAMDFSQGTNHLLCGENLVFYAINIVN